MSLTSIHKNSTKNPSVRIQKLLAHHGLGSRRQIESWIADRRIKIDGQIAQLGDRLNHYQNIQLDGKLIRLSKQKNVVPKIIVYHKPTGEVCSRKDEQGRRTKFESLPELKNNRWVCIGRLDLNTSGLLLLTNNGDWAHQLMHPSSQVEREYAVRVLGHPSLEDISALKAGIKIDGASIKFDAIKEAGGEGANRWFHVIVKEGKYRMVRRLWEARNMTVSRLIRVRYGNICLPKRIRMGQSILLEPTETKALMNLCQPQIQQF